jgi:hypothetical protein
MAQSTQKRQSNTLVICGCSKSKLNTKAKAIDLYQGQIFRSIKKYTETHGYELLILSAKYGLIEKNKLIHPYDQTLKNKKDIQELAQKLRKNNLTQKITQFKRIELIMGNNYLEALLPVTQKTKTKKNKIYIIEKTNGIFDFKKNLRKLLDNDRSVLKIIRMNTQTHSK